MKHVKLFEGYIKSVQNQDFELSEDLDPAIVKAKQKMLDFKGTGEMAGIYYIEGDPYIYKVIRGVWNSMKKEDYAKDPLKGGGISLFGGGDWTPLKGNAAATQKLDKQFPEARPNWKTLKDSNVSGGLEWNGWEGEFKPYPGDKVLLSPGFMQEIVRKIPGSKVDTNSGRNIYTSVDNGEMVDKSSIVVVPRSATPGGESTEKEIYVGPDHLMSMLINHGDDLRKAVAYWKRRGYSYSMARVQGAAGGFPEVGTGHGALGTVRTPELCVAIPVSPADKSRFIEDLKVFSQTPAGQIDKVS